MQLAIALLLSSGTLVGTPACQRRQPAPAPPQPAALGATDIRPRRLHGRLGPGSTCAGRDDCTSEQVCVGGVCRQGLTSAAGEVLAAAATAQAQAGDLVGAVKTYDEAAAAFAAAEAPVPPEITCQAASLALRAASTPESREDGAKRADACFRASLPGDAARAEVARLMGTLRHEGLDVRRLDLESRADRFFAKPPTSPTIDLVEVVMTVPVAEGAEYAVLAAVLRSDTARRAVADCFVRDWELRHERAAEAALVMQYSSQPRQQDGTEVYDPDVAVTSGGSQTDTFAACAAQGLTALVRPGPRPSRLVAWQQPITVAARLR